MTMYPGDGASLLAEAQDLVSDRALPCDLCRRRVRYFSVRGDVAMRCYGRGYRCAVWPVPRGLLSSGRTCRVRASCRSSRLNTGRRLRRRYWLSTEMSAEPIARHRQPLFVDDLERLCLQLPLGACWSNPPETDRHLQRVVI